MKIIEMNLKSEYFDKIKNGSKTIELRLFDEKRQQLNLNDIIVFNKEPERTEQINVSIVGLLRYNSFQDLLQGFFDSRKHQEYKEKFSLELPENGDTN